MLSPKPAGVLRTLLCAQPIAEPESELLDSFEAANPGNIDLMRRHSGVLAAVAVYPLRSGSSQSELALTQGFFCSPLSSFSSFSIIFVFSALFNFGNRRANSNCIPHGEPPTVCSTFP